MNNKIAMKDKRLYDMRKEYSPPPLQESLLISDPVYQFEKWFEEARKVEKHEPNAMILSTCGDDGAPSSRVVLLKKYSAEGYVFFTNYESRKGNDISRNPKASLLFYWPGSMRQIRIEGHISRISPADSDEYFDSRPAESKASAILSKQSRPLSDKERFDRDVKELAADGILKRPCFWGGYQLIPRYYEFWQGATGRTHDRFSYNKEGEEWLIKRLYP